MSGARGDFSPAQIAATKAAVADLLMVVEMRKRAAEILKLIRLSEAPR